MIGKMIAVALLSAIVVGAVRCGAVRRGLNGVDIPIAMEWGTQPHFVSAAVLCERNGRLDAGSLRMNKIQTPTSSERLPVSTYLAVRAWLLQNDADAERMLSWTRHEVAPPTTAEIMAREIIWIILCAGRSAQSARTIEKKVLTAIAAGTPIVEAFGYRAKASAIERAWRDRHEDFANFQRVVSHNDPESLVAWCKSIPFIGDDTQFQLAKNFGADVCKPDIWLCRLAGIPDKPRRPVKARFLACMDLCRTLALATNDRIASVDSILWLACNKGVLVTDGMAGSVRFAARKTTAMSIYESAEAAPATTTPDPQLTLGF